MAELKTQENDSSVEAFLATVDEKRQADARAVVAMMQQATGKPPRMWGSSIIGFDRYAYTYASGRSGEWFQVGLSPRKRNLTLYIMPGFADYDGLLSRLGKHRTGKSCLYISRLSDVDQDVLRQLITDSVAAIRARD